MALQGLTSGLQVQLQVLDKYQKDENYRKYRVGWFFSSDSGSGFCYGQLNLGGVWGFRGFGFMPRVLVQRC